MLGAIAGDIIGSIYEFQNVKVKDFPLFTPRSCPTDDTILSIATAEVLLTGGSYAQQYKAYYRRYPSAGYGGMFHRWGASETLEPYNSFGNGSAMRVSPIGFAFDTLEKVLQEAQRSAEVTHNHPEGIKGAQATATAIFLARKGSTKEEIRDYIESTFEYDLHASLDEIRSNYTFDVTCQGSVPQAIIAFLESVDFEDAIRGAISIGGDSDTIACITGGIAHAYYGGVPKEIAEQTLVKLTSPLCEVVKAFMEKYSLQADYKP